MAEKKDGIEGWAILELMGHRRLGGYVCEHEVGGHSFVRIDVPATDGREPITQFYSPGAVYCLTPATESTARAVASLGAPRPVERYEVAGLISTGLIRPPAVAVEDEVDEFEPIDAEIDEELELDLVKCRKCGCTNLTPCETDSGPCGWAEADLCTACVGEVEEDRTGIDASAVEPLEGES